MHFLLDPTQNPSQFGKHIYVHLGLIWPFQEILLIMCFGATINKISTFKNTYFGIPLFIQKFFWYLSAISHKQLSPKPINHAIFCNNSRMSSMCTAQTVTYVAQYIAQTVTNVLLLSPKNKKKSVISDILKTLNMGVNMITRQMTPCFSYIF